MSKNKFEMELEGKLKIQERQIHGLRNKLEKYIDERKALEDTIASLKAERDDLNWKLNDMMQLEYQKEQMLMQKENSLERYRKLPGIRAVRLIKRALGR